MAQEEKLLLKYLCAILPYNVHCRVFKLNGDVKENDDVLYGVIGDNVMTLKSDKDECLMYYQIKPYLRPMSIMTDVERFIYKNTSFVNKLGFCLRGYWDFYELIPKGLALEAPEDMYK